MYRKMKTSFILNTNLKTHPIGSPKTVLDSFFFLVVVFEIRNLGEG